MTRRTALQFIAQETWAIRPDWLETICQIAEREHEYAGDVQALEQRLGRPLANTERTTIRDGVAVVPVSGPLFRYANLMTDLSGATSYGMLAQEIRAAVDDPAVTAIVLNIDSPGGAVKGVNELGKQIAAVRGVKPIVAYVGGTGASAAYWLASQADEIVADDAAELGSIGTMSGVTLRDARQGEKSYVFTSRQSPLKNASPESEAGAAEFQRQTDALADVFISAVAAGRGTTTEDVLQNYGQGAVFTGTVALQRGMIDSIGTLEGVIERLSSHPAAGGLTARSIAMATQQGTAQSQITAALIREQHPAVAAELIAEGKASVNVADIEAAARSAGAAAERERIASIEALAMPGTEELVAGLKADGSVTAEAAAVKILQAVRAGAGGAQQQPKQSAGQQHLQHLKGTEDGINPPKAGAQQGNDGGDDDDIDAAVKADMEAARKAGILD